MNDGLVPVQVSLRRSRGRGSDRPRRAKERLKGRRVEDEDWLEVKLREMVSFWERERKGLIREGEGGVLSE